MTKFIQVLESLADDSSLSIRALAKQVGIAYQELYAYKNDNYYPSIFNAEKLAKYFDVSIDYLFWQSEIPKTTQYTDVNISLFFPRYIALLKEKNVSHYSLYKNIGLNNSSITKWKNGSIPKFDSLIKIADYFSTNLDYLVGRRDIRY